MNDNTTNNEKMYFEYAWQYKKEDLKFCPRCGNSFKLQDIHIPNQPQLVCHSCKFIFYLDPKLIVVAYVLCRNKVLLLKRNEEPSKGKWGFPGGHVERGVCLYDAIQNEVLEEAGLKIKVGDILETFSWGESIQLVFKAVTNSDKIKVNIESQEGKFFAPDEIPWDDLAFASTKTILEKYFNN